MIPDAIEIRLSRKERAELEARLRAATTEQRHLLRARIVLKAAEGTATREIARELDTTPTTVSLWRGALRAKDLTDLKICRGPVPRPSTAQRPTSAFAQSWTNRRLKDMRVGTDH